eukprot:GEMP01042255.1.p1 GENE.GEMP01042255.1~~GEMP01042255.1.p1  ORF type:complete len:216 (-),score=15.75 GEMP01042255.1:1188-1835(-)
MTLSFVEELESASSVGIWTLIAIETLLVCFLTFSHAVPTFLARKLCHAGTGLLLMRMGTENLIVRCYVYMVVCASLAMTWELGLPAFRFGKPRDKGISIYLLLVCFWFYNQLPVSLLAPVFFADPLGAIVGKFVAKYEPHVNVIWYREKTVLGSMAVLTTTFACLGIGPGADQLGVPEKLILSVMACAAEAVGGEYDNLALALVVLPGRYFFAPW